MPNLPLKSKNTRSPEAEPCPRCGSLCDYIIDLDASEYCNDCRGVPLHKTDGGKGFNKGRTGNPAGRPKGAKNRTTEELRKALQQVFAGNLEGLEKDLKAMKPFFRWTILMKIADKFMPSLTQSDIDATVAGQMVIEVRYGADPDADVNTTTTAIKVLGDNSYGDDDDEAEIAEMVEIIED